MGGRVEDLRLRSGKGSECHLKNPWPGREVNVLRDGRPVHVERKGAILRFATEPGAEYEVRARGAQRVPPWTPAAESGPLAYRGPTHMCEVPEADRADVWLGMPPDGPAADGHAPVNDG